MKPSTLAFAALALAIPFAALAKDPTWMTKPPAEWTAEDVTEVLGKSPWVANIAVLPTTLMSGKQDKPIASSQRVPVQARWFSSRMIKQAIARNAELAGARMSEEEKSDSTRPDDRFYEILVSAEKLEVLDAIPFAELQKTTTIDADGESFPLVTLLRPSDLKGSQAQFIFRKGKGIPEGAKSITMKTEWNGAKLEFKWDPTKMVWTGSCDNGAKPTHQIVGDAKADKVQVRDLDGDFCPIGPNEARRREIQAAILASGDDKLDRALGDVRVTRPTEKDKFGVYVFYDPSKESADAAEAAKVDSIARQASMARAIGKWSASNKSPLKMVFFLKPGARMPEHMIHASCAEKLAKLEPAAAEKLFKDKAVDANAKTLDTCEGPDKAAPAASEATPKPAKTAKTPKK